MAGSVRRPRRDDGTVMVMGVTAAVVAGTVCSAASSFAACSAAARCTRASLNAGRGSGRDGCGAGLSLDRPCPDSDLRFKRGERLGMGVVEVVLLSAGAKDERSGDTGGGTSGTEA